VFEDSDSEEKNVDDRVALDWLEVYEGGGVLFCLCGATMATVRERRPTVGSTLARCL
jgi:hypothetical protein